MRANLTAIAFACYLFVTIFAVDIESDNPDVIDDHSYEYYQITRPDEIRQNCELDEMLAYGLAGDAMSLGEKNEICPNLSQNCCGKKDQARIWEYWHRDRKRQEYYHRAVLKIMKYFLGFGKEWHRIAEAIIEDYSDKELGAKNKSNGMNRTNNQKEEKNFIDKGLVVNANKYCKEAADFVAKLDFNTKEKAHTYYRLINEKTEFLENARRSFYCVLCSVEGQRAISTYFFKYINNFMYNDNFCKTMVNHGFRITYELYNTYNEYISSLLKMVQCVNLTGGNNRNVTGGSNTNNYKSNRPPTELSPEEKKLIENPLDNDASVRFEACNYVEGYAGITACRWFCGKFNMAKPTTELDLNLTRLMAVYKRIKPYEEIFVSSRTNFFYDDMKRMHDDIIDNAKHVDKSGLFYKTIVQHIDIASYTTNFWIGTGIDPMEVARGNVLPIKYKTAQIAATALIVVILAFVYRG